MQDAELEKLIYEISGLCENIEQEDLEMFKKFVEDCLSVFCFGSLDYN